MIDILLKSYLIEKKPYYSIFLGFIFASLGIGFSYLVFKDAPSFPTIFLTTLATAPVVIRLIKNEEWEPKFEKIFQRHKKAIETYFYLFFGMSFAFAIFYAFLPEDHSSLIFSEQIKKFSSGAFSIEFNLNFLLEHSSLFSKIVINNLGLLFFFFLLSLFYGSGSLLLLSWNASILGVMWGKMIKALFNFSDSLTFVTRTFFNFPYLLPEVLAYFLASIAGAIVSINLTKKTKIGIAIIDSLFFLAFSIVIIIIAGIIETSMLTYFI
ncbi:MAG: hypothetical protein QXK49_01615 [Candidatus Aenigmatarchaeota archaeon]